MKNEHFRKWLRVAVGTLIVTYAVVGFTFFCVNQCWMAHVSNARYNERGGKYALAIKSWKAALAVASWEHNDSNTAIARVRIIEDSRKLHTESSRMKPRPEQRNQRI